MTILLLLTISLLFFAGNIGAPAAAILAVLALLYIAASAAGSATRTGAWLLSSPRHEPSGHMRHQIV